MKLMDLLWKPTDLKKEGWNLKHQEQLKPLLFYPQIQKIKSSSIFDVD